MYKQNGNSIKDSGFGSKFSSFSFDGECSFDASTPKKINERKIKAQKTQKPQQQTFAISQQKNAEISHRKAANCFKSFNGVQRIGEPHHYQQLATHRKKTSDTNDTKVFLDCKTIALISLIFVFAVLVIAYKMILVAMPYTNSESFYEASSFAQEKFSKVVDWAREIQLSTSLNPLFCGLAVALFTFMMVYMDSAIPGVNPPMPFHTSSKADYGQPKTSNINLNYLTAFAAGIVVTTLMWVV